MGWKTINGHRYYYKSRRVGGRIETTYVGAGEPALLVARIDTMERLEKAASDGPSGRNGRGWTRRTRRWPIGSTTSRPWPTPRWRRPGSTSIGASGGGSGDEQAEGDRDGEAGPEQEGQGPGSGPGNGCTPRASGTG